MGLPEADGPPQSVAESAPRSAEGGDEAAPAPPPAESPAAPDEAEAPKAAPDGAEVPKAAPDEAGAPKAAPDEGAATPEPAEPRAPLAFADFTLGVGVGLGIFIDSSAQRDYIEDWKNSQGDLVVDIEGSSDLPAYYVPMLTVTYAPMDYVRLRGLGEFGWGPKFVDISNGDSHLFNYVRGSAGALASLEFPLHNAGRLVALDVSAGALVHWISFEEHSARALGFRGQISGGFAGSRHLFAEIFLAYDHVAATSDADSSFDLNYSAVLFGAALHYAPLGG